MSGMASTSVYSKYYSFYMDTGISISLAPPPNIEGMDSDNGHYISDYFESEEQLLIESASHYMAIVDLWVEDEINTYKTPLTDVFSNKTSVKLSYLCAVNDIEYSVSGEQNIFLNLKHDVKQETITMLQERLCLWKTKHSARKLIPIDIKNINVINKKTSYGTFTAIGGNLRSDIALYWNKHQLDSLEKWVPVVKSAIQSIEHKFTTKILSSETNINDNNRQHAHRINASWGPALYTAWFVEADKSYAEEISYAISYYIQEAEFSAQLIDALSLDTIQFLKFYKVKNPITPLERQKMQDEIEKIENDMQKSFKPFGVSISIKTGKSANYAYNWDAVRRLHDNLALFNRLLNEVKDIGLIMKKNGVSIIEFNHHTWDEVTSNRINMEVQLNSAKNNAKRSIDIHFNELIQKKNKAVFYETLLGIKGIDTDDFDIEVIKLE